MRITVELLTATEAGQVLGVGVSRVRQLHGEGLLPAAITLPGPLHLFESGDVERLRADREAARAKRRAQAAA